MDALLPALSFSAVSSTFVLFLCGLPICRRIHSLGSTHGTSSAPFLIAFVSCAYWTQYGFTRNDHVVIFINIVGLTLQTAYLLYYYMMTNRKAKRPLRNIILLELLLIAAMEWIVQKGDLPDKGEAILGIACVVLNVSNIAAPLFDLGEVFRKKSSESLPFPLCVANFAVSVQWFLYGTIVKDVVIQVPNVVSILLSVAQLSLFWVYPPQNSPSESSARIREPAMI